MRMIFNYLKIIDVVLFWISKVMWCSLVRSVNLLHIATYYGRSRVNAL